MAEPTPTNHEESRTFRLHDSLHRLQELTAQIHEYCAQNNPGGAEAYQVLLTLRSMAGGVHAAAISETELASTIQEIQKTLSDIQRSSQAQQNDTLRLSMESYARMLEDVQKLFNLSSSPKQHNGISRRSFLVGMLTAAAAIASYNAARHIPSIDRGEISESGLLQSVVEYLRQKHGLEIYTSIPLTDASFVFGEKPTMTELEAVIMDVKNAVDQYPPGYFTQNGISGISLLKNLRKSTGAVGGLALVMSGYIALEVQPSIVWTEFTLHHEFYHMADRRIGIEDVLVSDESARNAEWIDAYACNCNVYSTDAPISEDTFVNDYSRTNPLEDRAETAAHLLTPSLHRELLQRISSMSDSEEKRILQEKIKQIKEHYLLWSNGLMDEQYWNDLLEGKVSSHYFIGKM